MSHVKDVEYYWLFTSSYHLGDKYLPLFPARTKYFLAICDFDLKTNPNFNEELKILNWNDKRIDSIECIDLQQLNI